MAQEPTREVLDLLLAWETERQPVANGVTSTQTGGLLVGVLTSIDAKEGGVVVFDAPTVDTPLLARTIVPLTSQDVGRQVCLMFEKGDLTKPVILGFLQAGVTPGAEVVAEERSDSARSVEARVDGERIILEGSKEIVLKCGKASITLKQDGRVLIRGAYLSSQSTGPNLIKGGSVQLN